MINDFSEIFLQNQTESITIILIMYKFCLFQLCEPVRKLPKCRYFRDITWTLITKGDNLTQQIVHCVCPKDAVAYMIKRQAYTTEDNQVGFKFSFACSPQSVSTYKPETQNFKVYLFGVQNNLIFTNMYFIFIFSESIVPKERTL